MAAQKLLDQVRDVLCSKHSSYNTEKACIHWIRRYIHFHHKRHTADMAETEIVQFLNQVAITGPVAASAQNQALNAIVFTKISSSQNWAHSRDCSGPKNLPACSTAAALARKAPWTTCKQKKRQALPLNFRACALFRFLPATPFFAILKKIVLKNKQNLDNLIIFSTVQSIGDGCQ